MYLAAQDAAWEKVAWQTAATRAAWLKDAEAPGSINPWERAKRKAGLTPEPPQQGFDLGDFDSFGRGLRGET